MSLIAFTLSSVRGIIQVLYWYIGAWQPQVPVGAIINYENKQLLWHLICIANVFATIGTCLDQSNINILYLLGNYLSPQCKYNDDFGTVIKVICTHWNNMEIKVDFSKLYETVFMSNINPIIVAVILTNI